LAEEALQTAGQLYRLQVAEVHEHRSPQPYASSARVFCSSAVADL